MSQSEWTGLWEGMRHLIGQLQQGRYWTDRRDACEELHKVGRQAITRLRQGAEDSDPDVSHWSRQACQELGKDLITPIEEVAHKLDAELAEGGWDPDSPEAAKGAASPTRSAAPPDRPEELLEWLEQFATQAGGVLTRKELGGSLSLPVANGRKQTIFINLAQKEAEGDPLVLFYSICGAARPEIQAWALQANCSLSAGAFGVIQHQGGSMLIMMMRWRMDEIRGANLEPKLKYLAEKADWAESRLSDQDVH